MCPFAPIDINVIVAFSEFRTLQAQADSLEKYIALSCLGQDLASAVEAYGRVLVSEIGLPFEAKSIRPREPRSNQYWCQVMV